MSLMYAMPHPRFAGEHKVNPNWLQRIEGRLAERALPYIPVWIRSYHLTLLTIAWSAAAALSGYLASTDLRWLWLMTAALAAQHVTDTLDGPLGKYRKEGLLRWGYYMDHFLDYLFLCSLIIGYAWITPGNALMYLYILAILGGFMVNSYLSFAATDRFTITYFGIGPSEIRLLFMLINTMLIVFGSTYVGFLLPTVLLVVAIGLISVTSKTAAAIWKQDRAHNIDLD